MIWVVLHQMESQDKPEKVADFDVEDDRDTIDIDDLIAEMRMRPGVDIPAMAPGDHFILLDEEDFQLKLAQGEVVDPEARRNGTQ